MNKKIWGAALIATMAVAAGWNYQQNKQCVELSDLASANVEALASGEGSGIYPCWLGWDNGSPGYYFEYTDCEDCSTHTATSLWDQSKC